MSTQLVIVLLLLTGSCLSLASGLFGGDTDIDVNDDDIQKLAKAAVDQLNARSNSMFKSKLVTLKSAKVQLVSGLLYKLKLDVGTSDCRKGDTSKQLDDCAVTQMQECAVKLWVQSWTDKKELTEFNCTELHRMVVGPRIQKEGGLNENSKQSRPEEEDVVIADKQSLLDNLPGSFQAFKLKYARNYANDGEEKQRYQVFVKNMHKADKLQRMELGTATYGATEFADMTEEEFRKYRLTPTWDTSYDPFLKQALIPNDAPPTQFDWRTHGAVTPVKNQGSCGSCWAFSTTGNVEGQWAIKKKQLVSLSEQELVDCDKLDEGCNGGLPSNAYKAIIKLGGLETEKEYPYEGRDDKCVFNKTEAKIDINGGLNISSNENDMAAWLAKNGPISIGINANAMQFYFGGISHPWKIFCNPSSLDHGVLIVGYGVRKSTPYWIIKNSWGRSWGEKGYYLVYRGGGVCGLNRMATSAVIN
ncbi:Cathepsin F [Lamellibrachia satsuma]|nr:Cathepsin F [Lamellibrachia satsuma]